MNLELPPFLKQQTKTSMSAEEETLQLKITCRMSQREAEFHTGGEQEDPECMGNISESQIHICF